MKIQRQIVLALGLALLALAQPDLKNTVTFSGGHAFNVGGNAFHGSGGASLGGSYRYRLLPALDLEGGVFTAWDLSNELLGQNYRIIPHDSYLWGTFGVRGIVPIKLKRIEVSGGLGGLYGRYKGFETPTTGLISPSTSWGGYVSGGAAVALDRNRHFWIGGSPHYFLSNGKYVRDRWVVITGDVSFRF